MFKHDLLSVIQPLYYIGKFSGAVAFRIKNQSGNRKYIRSCSDKLLFILHTSLYLYLCYRLYDFVAFFYYKKSVFFKTSALLNMAPTIFYTVVVYSDCVINNRRYFDIFVILERFMNDSRLNFKLNYIKVKVFTISIIVFTIQFIQEAFYVYLFANGRELHMIVNIIPLTIPTCIDCFLITYLLIIAEMFKEINANLRKVGYRKVFLDLHYKLFGFTQDINNYFHYLIFKAFFCFTMLANTVFFISCVRKFDFHIILISAEYFMYDCSYLLNIILIIYFSNKLKNEVLVRYWDFSFVVSHV